MRYYIIIKESKCNYKKTQKTLHVYAPDNKASNCLRQQLIEVKVGIDTYTITVGDINIPLSVTDGSSRQKISRHINDLKSTLNQHDLIEIYRLSHSLTTEYILLKLT